MPLITTPKLKELKSHKSKVHSVAWSKDGLRLASGSPDKTAKIWAFSDFDSLNVVSVVECKGHQDAVDQVAWDHSSLRLATASADKTVRIWDEQGNCLQKINTHGENINICWSPDGNRIAVGSKNDIISIINWSEGKIEKQIEFAYEVNEISWNSDGSLFYLTTGQGNVAILQYPSMKVCKSFFAHTANCYCIDFENAPSSATGNFAPKVFATGGADAIVALWDADDLICIKTFTELNAPIRTLSFSCDNEYVAAGSEDLFINISSVDTGKSAHKLQVTSPVNSLAWNPKRNLLAYAGDEIDSRTGLPLGNIWLAQFY